VPFTVLNRPDAAYLDQAEPDSVDFQILGDDRFGVLGTGGDGTQQASPNMTVALTATTALVDGQMFSVNGSNVNIAAAEANPRFDLITVNATGAWEVIKGTASTNARFPIWDRLRTVYYAVYIPAGATAITNDLITDKRRRVEVTFKRRAATGTDIAVDVGTFAAGNKWTLDANGKMVWENGTTDLSIERTTQDVLSVNGAEQITTVSNTVPTLVLKAKAGQTADLLQIQDSTGAVIARIDSTGVFTSANLRRGTLAQLATTSAGIGSMYQRTDIDSTQGSVVFYVKETGTGTTGWQQVSAYDPAILPLPIGTVLGWPGGADPGAVGANIPAGFLWLNGQDVSRTTYATLFGFLGGAYGAIDGATFRLPDLRGRMPVGYSSTTGRFNNSNGKYWGGEVVTLGTSHLPALSLSGSASTYDHSHGGTVYSSTAGGHTHSVTGGAYVRGSPGYVVIQRSGGNNSVATQASGGMTAYNDADIYSYGTAGDAGGHSHSSGVGNDSHGHTITVSGWPGTNNQPHENCQPSALFDCWIIKAL